jgi:hypothetical protein
MTAPLGLLAASAIVVGLLAGGCGGQTPPAPVVANLSGSFDDGGVTVTATAILRSDDTGTVRVAFNPDKPGYHLYSIDLPSNGVHGIGIPTIVTVGGQLRAAGPAVADAIVATLRIDPLDADLPVYPDGPVAVTVPVRVQAGGDPARVVVTYGACSAVNCLMPVRDRTVTLT